MLPYKMENEQLFSYFFFQEVQSNDLAGSTPVPKRTDDIVSGTQRDTFQTQVQPLKTLHSNWSDKDMTEDEGFIMYSIQKAEQRPNVPGWRIVTWNVGSPVSCHLQRKTFQLNECYSVFFFINMNISKCLTHPAAKCSHSHGSFSHLSWPRAEMQTHSQLSGGAPSVLYACVYPRMGAQKSPGSVRYARLHTHTRTERHTQWVVNISWAAVYFTTLTRMRRSPLTDAKWKRESPAWWNRRKQIDGELGEERPATALGFNNNTLKAPG